MKKERKSGATGRKISKAVMSALLVVGVIVAAILIWNIGVLVFDAYGFDITLYKTDMASTIYAVDRDGNYKEYEQLYSEERRVWVPIDKIPVHVQKAAVAIEDERFYSHQGVDLKRTIGAFGGWLTGRKDYGGSTITQQLIKNVTDEKDTTATRKAKEIFRALVLETQLEKEEILEYYLNVVYFANSSYGIQTAAQTYFSKDAKDLTLAEGAAIVGITQAPSYYNPFENPENNKEKQELVLGKMLELNFITEEEYHAAVNEKLDFIKNGDRHDGAGGINSYFAEALVDELVPELMKKLNIPEEQAKQLIYTGGLKIYSTLEANVQKNIDKYFSNDGEGGLFPTLSGDVQPEAAIAVISVEDGSVKGVYGQAGKKTANLTLNRAIDTTRQPGSSIKPLAVYGPAMELGLVQPGSVVVDEPYSRGSWHPQNWYKGYKGAITIQEAVVQSMNIPAIKTLEQVGVETAFDFAKNKLGLSTLVDPGDRDLAPLALGGLTKGVTVLEMTAAYNAFAADGIYTEPYFYTKVTDRDGKVLIEKEIETRRVFSKKTAKYMTGVLRATAQGPLGLAAALSDRQSAGKTGSTNEDKDRWYMGYTTYYTAGVWYGYDIAETLPYYATRQVPHKLWKNVMTEVHRGLPIEEFEGIDYVISPVKRFYLCEDTGLVAVDNCPNKKEVLEQETEGLAICHLHSNTVVLPSGEPVVPNEEIVLPDDYYYEGIEQQ
ncbi:MAG: PBP1A family penicillin-binding protein [Clostridia bacterium]|nr:PBP1A family penicillin-binding protein [Clostridia bacterium]